MRPTWNGYAFDWVNVVYFGAIHAIALTAPWHFTWTGLGATLFLYWLSGSVGICLACHRLLTHRGLAVSKPLAYLLTLAGMLASEGGAISWVAMHRVHHVASDKPGRDLHTPKDGFLWSHLGWILCKLPFDRRQFEREHAPEHRGRSRAPCVQSAARRAERRRRPGALRLGRVEPRRLGRPSCGSSSTWTPPGSSTPSRTSGCSAATTASLRQQR